VKRVGEQVLPSELAAFLTRTGEVDPIHWTVFGLQ
jgi:hypothetical protein